MAGDGPIFKKYFTAESTATLLKGANAGERILASAVGKAHAARAQQATAPKASKQQHESRLEVNNRDESIAGNGMQAAASRAREHGEDRRRCCSARLSWTNGLRTHRTLRSARPGERAGGPTGRTGAMGVRAGHRDVRRVSGALPGGGRPPVEREVRVRHYGRASTPPRRQSRRAVPALRASPGCAQPGRGGTPTWERGVRGKRLRGGGPNPGTRTVQTSPARQGQSPAGPSRRARDAALRRGALQTTQRAGLVCLSISRLRGCSVDHRENIVLIIGIRAPRIPPPEHRAWCAWRGARCGVQIGWGGILVCPHMRLGR